MDNIALTSEEYGDMASKNAELAAYASATKGLPKLSDAAGYTDKWAKEEEKSTNDALAKFSAYPSIQEDMQIEFAKNRERTLNELRRYEESQLKAAEKMDSEEYRKQSTESSLKRILTRCETDRTLNAVGADAVNAMIAAKVSSLERERDEMLFASDESKKDEIEKIYNGKIAAAKLGSELKGVDFNAGTEQSIKDNTYSIMQEDMREYYGKRLRAYEAITGNLFAAKQLAEEDSRQWAIGLAEEMISSGDFMGLSRVLDHIDENRKTINTVIDEKTKKPIDGMFDFAPTFYWTSKDRDGLRKKCAAANELHTKMRKAQASIDNENMRIEAGNAVYDFGREIDKCREAGYEMTDALIDSVADKYRKRLDIIRAKGFNKIQEYDQKFRADIKELKTSNERARNIVLERENAYAKTQGDANIRVAQSDFGIWARETFDKLPSGEYEKNVIYSGNVNANGDRINVTGRVQKIGYLGAVINSRLCDEETRAWAKKNQETLIKTDEREIADRITRLLAGTTADRVLVDADEQRTFVSRSKVSANVASTPVTVKTNNNGDGSVKVNIPDNAIVRMPFNGGYIKMSGSDLRTMCDEITSTMWNRVDEREIDYITMRDRIIGNILSANELKKITEGDEVEFKYDGSMKTMASEYGKEKSRQLKGQITMDKYIGNPRNFTPYIADIERRADSIRSEIMKTHGTTGSEVEIGVDQYKDIFTRNLFN